MTPPPLPKKGLQLRSLLKAEGELEVSVVEEPVAALKEDQVLVRVEAAPINPSDLGLLFGPADLSQAKVTGQGLDTVLRAPVTAGAVKALAGRVGESMSVGNEGAGTVIAAGSSSAAQRLMGKAVAVLGGSMYSQYRTVSADDCLELEPGTSAKQGASAFVNPLTALGMVETMRFEGHGALVHHPAASALGQMLVKLCAAERIELVNIVRKPEQEKLLRDLGAKYVLNSTAPDFKEALVEAIAATGATLAFEASGGGTMASDILNAMEKVLGRSSKKYSRYGSSTLKQVYLYGSLDNGPTELRRGYGMAWSLGGWLVFPFLNKVGPGTLKRLKERVAKELTTTFATSYSREISLSEALQPAVIAAFARPTTGSKFLILPHG